MKKKILTLAVLLLCAVSVNAAVPSIGDVDDDGYLTATDAAIVMQRVLDENVKMPIEKTRSYMYIADADGDDVLTATDATLIMQKVLDPKTKFKWEESSYNDWYNRKGEASMNAYIAEQQAGATLFSAAQTYATDLYTMGKWQASLKMDTDDLFAAQLLTGDKQRYDGFKIYTIDSALTPAVIKVEKESENSPFGKTVYPPEVDEYDKEWDTEYGIAYVSPIDVYSAAQTYVTDLYTMGKWTGKEEITVEDLLKAKLLLYRPNIDYTIITSGDPLTPAIRSVTWVEDGYKKTYNSGMVTWEDAEFGSGVIRAAAQTYAYDLYNEGKWEEYRVITDEDLVNAHLLTKKPIVDYSVHTTMDEYGPKVNSVSWFSNGSGHSAIFAASDPISHDEAKNGASTVFSAAQTYATDMYTAGQWSDNMVITLPDLVKAQLLTKMSSMYYVIVPVKDKNTPAIHYVYWYENGVKYIYPEE